MDQRVYSDVAEAHRQWIELAELVAAARAWDATQLPALAQIEADVDAARSTADEWWSWETRSDVEVFWSELGGLSASWPTSVPGVQELVTVAQRGQGTVGLVEAEGVDPEDILEMMGEDLGDLADLPGAVLDAARGAGGVLTKPSTLLTVALVAAAGVVLVLVVRG